MNLTLAQTERSGWLNKFANSKCSIAGQFYKFLFAQASVHVFKQRVGISTKFFAFCPLEKTTFWSHRF